MAKKDKASYNAYMNKYMKERYERRRSEAVASLGGKCVVCGTTDRLELDHINPSLERVCNVDGLILFGN
jgi:5-methylcytosine-specific restriction endonuclease McrA